jgi:hypothetical protein
VSDTDNWIEITEKLTERIEQLEAAAAKTERMHTVERAFYDLTVKERDYERRHVDRLAARIDEVARRDLWAHLCAVHGGWFNPELTLTELGREHQHEHAGPGTIRSHPEMSTDWTPERLDQVLAEHAADR